jgi:putative sugar O-methyltransferase
MALAIADEPAELLRFQASPDIAPQICGGGGETYLNRLRESVGQSAYPLFLATYQESFCGDPQDLVNIDGCSITRSSMRHLYHLGVLHEFCRHMYSGPIDFVEIGGGYGNLARLAMQYDIASRYFLIDFPASLAVQYYYLTEFFDAGDVSIRNGDVYITGGPGSKICLTAPETTPHISEGVSRPNMLVSTMAMTEIPPGGQQYYLQNIDSDAVYVFGQTEPTPPLGSHLSGVRQIFNQGLFHSLAERYHCAKFVQGEFYTEILGILPTIS